MENKIHVPNHQPDNVNLFKDSPNWLINYNGAISTLEIGE